MNNIIDELSLTSFLGYVKGDYTQTFYILH